MGRKIQNHARGLAHALPLHALFISNKTQMEATKPSCLTKLGPTPS
jgi:hypothetical protein